MLRGGGLDDGFPMGTAPQGCGCAAACACEEQEAPAFEPGTRTQRAVRLPQAFLELAGTASLSYEGPPVHLQRTFYLDEPEVSTDFTTGVSATGIGFCNTVGPVRSQKWSAAVRARDTSTMDCLNLGVDNAGNDLKIGIPAWVQADTSEAGREAMFAELLPTWYAALSRSSLTEAESSSLVSVGDLTLNSSFGTAPSWAKYQPTKGLFWTEDALLGHVRLALRHLVAHLGVATGWPISNTGSREIWVVSGTSSSSYSDGCGGLDEATMLAFIQKTPVIIWPGFWLQQSRLTTDEQLWLVGQLAQQGFTREVTKNGETWQWIATLDQPACKALFLELGYSASSGLIVNRDNGTFTDNGTDEGGKYSYSAGKKQMNVCNKALLIALVSDYYFWWASRLLRYANASGASASSDYRTHATYAARAGLSAINFASGVMLHEYLHSSELCGDYRNSSYAGKKKGHCHADCMMNVQMSVFRRRLMARYGLPEEWDEERDRTAITEQQFADLGSTTGLKTDTWNGCETTSVDWTIASSATLGSGISLAYYIDGDCKTGTIPVSGSRLLRRG